MTESSAAAAELSTPVRSPGVFVLGMHRSGTSVMAGILDRLGLDGGPADTMFVADEFNNDGYWEQQPLVEMHDRMLQRLGGFASAPPVWRPPEEQVRRLPDASRQIEELVENLFHGPWFVKDPRHCLLLPLWSSALGNDDLAVVVLRSPSAVVRSLQRRNGYSDALAFGLWERYMLDLLRGLEGRPALVVRYEQLINDPRTTVRQIAEVVSQHIGSTTFDSVEHAVNLVNVTSDASASETSADSASGERILEVLANVVGYHPRFTLEQVLPEKMLPEQSRRIQRVLGRRRLALRTVGSIVGHDAVSRSQLDRRRSTPRRNVKAET